LSKTNNYTIVMQEAFVEDGMKVKLNGKDMD